MPASFSGEVTPVKSEMAPPWEKPPEGLLVLGGKAIKGESWMYR